MPQYVAYKIWQPSITFLDQVSVKKEEAFTQPSKVFMWFNNNTQKISFSEEFVMKLFCDYDFRLFPFDTQLCNLTFSEKEHELPDFILKSPKIYKPEGCIKSSFGPDVCFQPKISINRLSSSGQNFSMTGITIEMRRNRFYVLIYKYFIPLGMYSFLSQISFLIKAEVVSITTIQKNFRPSSV